MRELLVSIALLLSVAADAGQKQTVEAKSPLYDMQEILDTGTLVYNEAGFRWVLE